MPIQIGNSEVNDQLESYSKANKILSDQIKELRDYVDTIKASLPSKSIQNSNDSSSGTKSMINDRERKASEKEIDRM